MRFEGSFGKWLRQRRKALDLTQQDLADQVSYSVVTLRKIERDLCRPSKQMAEQLADVLAIAPDDEETREPLDEGRSAGHAPDDGRWDKSPLASPQ